MATSTTKYTCGGCPSTWTPLNACHCSGCHQTFSGLSYFDAHRKRDKCTAPQEQGLVLINGIWKSAEADDRFKETA